ncbi:hypothetical protein Tco_0077454 [Tanacetum coccineum]
MAAPIISISSDSSEESVGSRAPRVILFGAIPAIIPVIPEVPIVPADPIVAPEVGTVSVVSPAEVLNLVDYSSSSDFDPSEDSLPHIQDLPLVSPSGSSSHDTLAHYLSFPLLLLLLHPGFVDVQRLLSDPVRLSLSIDLTASILTGRVMAAPIISISSEESVGPRAPRVILFGAISAIILEVPIIPADPIVAPEVGTVSVVSPVGVLNLVDYSSFSYSDPSEDSLTHIPDLPLVSPSGSSSHDTLASLSKFPLAPIVAPPGIHRLRPIPARRLAWRRISHHLSDRHSSPDSSSSSLPSDHSLSRHTPPDTTDADSSTPQRFFHRSLDRKP